MAFLIQRAENRERPLDASTARRLIQKDKTVGYSHEIPETPNLKEIYKKIREVISDSKRRPDYHILFDKRISHYELKILEERGYIVDDVHMAGRKETKISWECS